MLELKPIFYGCTLIMCLLLHIILGKQNRFLEMVSAVLYNMKDDQHHD